MQLDMKLPTAAALSVAVVLGLAGCFSDAQSRAQIDLVEAFVDRPADPDWPYLDAVDVTASTCTGNVTCQQAVQSDYVTVLKFASVDDAYEYAAALGGDGVQIDPLVIGFRDDTLTTEQRLAIIQSVSGINASSPD
ncbi:hypothetical protein [Agromyces soli]|uniref:Lipoprotein n=1 Tax=Agromyces soli TaxID=659012 RepID=A0ABY4AUK4_9MICO|nr:hypothetical protein [Agromyces soli]UOE26690.1 hypothetical protein MTP13_02620 [Agromyces soli]